MWHNSQLFNNSSSTLNQFYNRVTTSHLFTNRQNKHLFHKNIRLRWKKIFGWFAWSWNFIFDFNQIVLSSADVWSLMSSREFIFQLKDNLFTDTMVCVQFLPTCLNQWCKQLCKYYFQSCQTSRQTTTQIWNRAC